MSRLRGFRGLPVGYCALLLAACGGAAAPAKSGNAPAGSEGAAPVTDAVAPKAVALDAVRVHLARPLHDLPVAGGLLAQPPYSDLLADPERFLPAFVSESAARAIDFSQPIDGAMSFDSPPTGAVAFRVRSSEVGKLVGREQGGRLRLAPGDAARLQACELWRAQQRLVCAPNATTLDAFGEALANLPAPASDASLVVEASGPTYQRKLAELLEKQRKEAAPNEDNSERTGREIAVELLRHDKLTAELGLTPRGVEFALSLGYSSPRRSPLLQSWLEGGLSPKALPAIPARGDFSLSYAGSDMFETLWDLLLDSVVKDMTETTMASAQDLKDTQRILERLAPPTGRFSFVSGANVPAALAALEQVQPEKSTVAQRRKLDRALAAWWVAAVDVDPKTFLEAVEEARRLGERDFKDKPNAKQPAKVRATSSKLTQSKSVPKGLPAGSLHFLDSVSPKKDFVPDAKHPAQDAHVNHILVVPDTARARVLLAVSRSEELAAQQALAALGNNPVAPAPAAMVALRLTPSGIAALSASFDSAQETAETKSELAALQRLPSKGQQELDVTGEIRRLAGNSGGLELRMAYRLTTAGASEWLTWVAGGMAKSDRH